MFIMNKDEVSIDNLPALAAEIRQYAGNKECEITLAKKLLHAASRIDAFMTLINSDERTELEKAILDLDIAIDLERARLISLNPGYVISGKGMVQ